MEYRGHVSVIVPIYNVEKELNRCVDSLLNQTYPYLEIILVDDGSPDQCGRICDDYARRDERVRVIHKKNAGLGMARNSGLEVASGEFILFVDSDDFVSNTHVEVLLNAITEENADMAITGYIRNFTDGRRIARQATQNRKVFQKDQILQEVLLPILGAKVDASSDVERTMSVWTNIYRKTLIDEHHLRFVSEREYVSEDLFFNIHYIMSANVIAVLPECSYFYSENVNSLTNAFRPDRFEKYCKMFLHETELLKSFGVFECAKLRVYRTLIMKAKKCISMIACSDMGLRKKMQATKEILENKIFNDVLQEYTPHVTEKRQRMQLFLLKHKMAIPLMVFYRQKYRRQL